MIDSVRKFARRYFNLINVLIEQEASFDNSLDSVHYRTESSRLEDNFFPVRKTKMNQMLDT